MKKLLPFALLLCIAFSLSGFTPAQHPASLTNKALWPTFPVTGQTTAGFATYDYAITPGGGASPYVITFYVPGTSTVVGGPYGFTLSFAGPSYNYYIASSASMSAQTGIRAVELYLYPSSSNVGVNFIPGL